MRIQTEVNSLPTKHTKHTKDEELLAFHATGLRSISLHVISWVLWAASSSNSDLSGMIVARGAQFFLIGFASSMKPLSFRVLSGSLPPNRLSRSAPFR